MDVEGGMEVEDVIVYMMQKMIYKKVALIDYNQKYQEADLALSRQLIACIYTPSGKLMPLIDVVRMKQDQTDTIRRRVVNQDPTHVSKKMVETLQSWLVSYNKNYIASNVSSFFISACPKTDMKKI